jgi:hypothetical protein
LAQPRPDSAADTQRAKSAIRGLCDRVVLGRFFRPLDTASSAPSDPGQWGTEVERAGAAGRGTALIDEGQRRLFEISDRALAAGDHKAAVAAVREAINSTKLMPQNHSAVDGFVNAMQEISDEQLDAAQRSVASDAGKTGGSGEATAPEHEQSS